MALKLKQGSACPIHTHAVLLTWGGSVGSLPSSCMRAEEEQCHGPAIALRLKHGRPLLSSCQKRDASIETEARVSLFYLHTSMDAALLTWRRLAGLPSSCRRAEEEQCHGPARALRLKHGRPLLSFCYKKDDGIETGT